MKTNHCHRVTTQLQLINIIIIIIIIIIIVCSLPGFVIFSPHCLTNGTICEKQSLNTKGVFWFSLALPSETFLILRRNDHGNEIADRRAKEAARSTDAETTFNLLTRNFYFLVLAQLHINVNNTGTKYVRIYEGKLHFEEKKTESIYHV